MQALEKLRDQLGQPPSIVSPTMAQVACWLSEHLMEIGWKTLDVVARDIGASPASVVRCCQLFGFGGYSNLQRLVRENLPTSDLVWKFDQADWNDREETVAVRIVRAEQRNLDRLAAVVEPQLQTLVALLLNARRIGVVAGMTSTSLGQYLATRLALLLGNVTFLEAGSSASWLFYRDLEADDLVIALSFPRYAKATLALVHLMQQKTEHVVVLTDPVGPRGLTVPYRFALPISGDLFSAGPPIAVFAQVLSHALRAQDDARILSQLERTDAMLTEAGVFLKRPRD